MADWARSWRRARRRALFLGLQNLLRAAGFARARAIGSCLGELQYRLAWRQRQRIQRDMALALQRRADDPAVPALLRQAYRVNNAAVIEILAMFDRKQSADALTQRCEIGGLEHLRTALSEGRGAILLGAHMGNVALLTIVLAHAGWPVSVVYREALMRSAGFFQRGLEQYGIQGIAANAGIRAYAQMLAALRQGRIVFMMLDQGVKHPRDGVMQRFLGKDVPMPAGPAQLARASRAPVLPVATSAAHPVWRFAVEPPLGPPLESLEADLARLVGVVERHVLRQPQLWSWHQRRWRKLPMAATAAAPAA